MKVVQINAVANSGSTGRIAEEIGNVLIANGHESYIAYGRGNATSSSKLIKIGSTFDLLLHGLYTLFCDKHGFGSKRATKLLVKKLKKYKPDLLALHNLHGYYLHLPTLFTYINESDIPVVWTLFDCWAFTGHCSYFDDIDCNKWKTHCSNCPKFNHYPASFIDNSWSNFSVKKELFTSVKNLALITHSTWLGDLVRSSTLRSCELYVTPSAINLDLFKPTKSNLRDRFNLENKIILLGCASVWSSRKGYEDFVELSYRLNAEFQIVMIGLNKRELDRLPAHILGLRRTESVTELAQWYTVASVFLNLTRQDNFPTTNIEALACGTPVITYNTGGSPESIDKQTGFVIEKGDFTGIIDKINALVNTNSKDISEACRNRAEKLYDKKTRYLDYLEIFEKISRKDK